ncbi:MAG: TAT-variant-translocated molybdopterin oxidoreductase [Fibrobacteria bacterium]|nr:TAT-variant-translocated molybdopterin oxidoreductase [Fibrobacteria bacterium]
MSSLNNNENNTYGNGASRRFFDSLKNKGKKHFWKSLDEFAESPAYKKFVKDEFPERASELLDPVNRRSFLGLMASSMALAGLSGCKSIRRPEEKILPYNNSPEYLVPGKPLNFATSMSLGQEVVGLVVESHEGRPTKIEGNALHPSSLGAASVFHQASLLNLYDPERSKTPLKQGKPSTWGVFQKEMELLMATHKANAGEGLSILSEYITSPSLAAVKKHMQNALPRAKWHSWEPVNRDNAVKGLKAATGQVVDAHYNFTKAERILAIDCDFLSRETGALINAKGFNEKRDPDNGRVNRLYIVESDFSLTGARADHRLRLKPSQVRKSLWLISDYVFNKLGVALPAGVPNAFKGLISEGAATAQDLDCGKWIASVCQDILEQPQQSLICVGKDQEPALHVLAHIINMALGCIGRTVHYKRSSTAGFNAETAGEVNSLELLVKDMADEKVTTLVMLGVNPVYTAPADFDFVTQLKKVKNVIHAGCMVDETAELSTWHLPKTHYLEEWSDGAAFNGVTNIAQPLIAPLYQAQSALEILAGLSGYPFKKGYDIVRNYWKSREGAEGFDKKWRTWIHDGLMKGSDSYNMAAGVSYGTLVTCCQTQIESLKATKAGELELLFKEDLSLYDGRFASNGWLQEFPDPMTRLAWDNAAVMSLKTAEKYGLRKAILLKDNKGIPLGQWDRPVIEIKSGDKKLELPVSILPGIADDTILLNLGYGRSKAGTIGSGAGVNVYPLRNSTSLSAAYNASLKNTGKKYDLANVQEHWSMEGRDIVRVEDVNVHHKSHQGHGAYESLWDEHQYDKGQQWGMVIDLNKCTGCGSCVVACQAENNIPIVGKDQVALNREMHWLRIDRYFAGTDLDNPQVVFQGIGCAQCEMAPCEAVCPVAATAHSSDGLNDMAYNRCVGTRYCANNCPYKVRRFNYYNLTNKYVNTQKMAQNPDVTVRFRGVMEKCSYCVQRINEQRIAHKNKGEEMVPDGNIVPACQQTCPSGAITFGDINDKNAKVTKLKHNKRNYELLAELNIRPRTSFLSRVTNLNPKMAKASKHPEKIDSHQTGRGEH